MPRRQVRQHDLPAICYKRLGHIGNNDAPELEPELRLFGVARNVVTHDQGGRFRQDDFDLLARLGNRDGPHLHDIRDHHEVLLSALYTA